jgi:hypothetical protein
MALGFLSPKIVLGFPVPGPLSDDEMRDQSHVKRLFRLEEGDFDAHHEHEVSLLLCQEMGRLFEDRSVSPEKALHKVKLQEALGLSFDRFIDLTTPEIEQVVLSLVQQLDFNRAWVFGAEEAAWVRRQIIALGTWCDLNGSAPADDPRAGYLYLLINPAMPGLVKVGHTRRLPEEHVLELSGATGVPLPFQLICSVRLADSRATEAFVHSALEERGVRVPGNREFFAAHPSEIVEIMMPARDSVGSGLA